MARSRRFAPVLVRTGQVAQGSGAAEAPERLSDMRRSTRLLARAGATGGPLQRTIDQSGLKVTLGTIRAGVGVAAVAYLAGSHLPASHARRGGRRRIAGMPSLAYVRCAQR